MSNPCETCNRSFGSNQALQQHLRDSPFHRPTFNSDEAPQQHRRDSVIPIPTPTFSCETCNKSFGSNQALQQHLRDSIIHQINHNCETCDISFRSDEALRQHLRDSRIHRVEGQHQDIETEPKLFEMFPELHEDVLEAVSGAMISPRFNHNDDDDTFDGADDMYPTNVMGNFTCKNRHSWSSKKVAIVIRGYPGNEYNAAVYYQRCRSCNELGALDLDDNSYVERVAYRLKRWAGVAVERPFFNEGTSPPHISELCEGCRAGYCQNNIIRRGI
jgi:hypothetical protein